MYPNQVSRPTTMPTAYRVKRSDPLPVKDIGLVFDDPSDLSGLADDSGNDSEQGEGLDDADDENDERYMYSNYVERISATITGFEITSSERITLGHLKADLLLVGKALRDTESLWYVSREIVALLRKKLPPRPEY